MSGVITDNLKKNIKIIHICFVSTNKVQRAKNNDFVTKRNIYKVFSE